MTKRVNTDGKFWAYKEVASLPDRSGKYRCTVIRFSDLGDWSETARNETVELHRRGTNPIKLVGPFTREEYNTMPTHGYCDVSDADADMTPCEWESIA